MSDAESAFGKDLTVTPSIFLELFQSAGVLGNMNTSYGLCGLGFRGAAIKGSAIV